MAPVSACKAIAESDWTPIAGAAGALRCSEPHCQKKSLARPADFDLQRATLAVDLPGR
jgi:hypothetical protein